jgi:hypothetical protein
MSKGKTVEVETIVRFMRLVNGDDLIAEINEDKETSLIVAHPMRLLIDADLDVGKQTIYMHTWMPQGVTKGDVCSLNKKDIILSAELEADIEEYYRGMVFEVFYDRHPTKVEPEKKEYMDSDKKVISIKSITRDK